MMPKRYQVAEVLLATEIGSLKDLCCYTWATIPAMQMIAYKTQLTLHDVYLHKW